MRPDIVTGGTYHDGIRHNAQVCVWSDPSNPGISLTLEDVKSWYWTSHTIINSVTAGNVDADDQIEIVTGGSNGINAQLCVWTGST